MIDQINRRQRQESFLNKQIDGISESSDLKFVSDRTFWTNQGITQCIWIQKIDQPNTKPDFKGFGLDLLMIDLTALSISKIQSEAKSIAIFIVNNLMFYIHHMIADNMYLNGFSIDIAELPFSSVLIQSLNMFIPMSRNSSN